MTSTTLTLFVTNKLNSIRFDLFEIVTCVSNHTVYGDVIFFRKSNANDPKL